MKCVCVLLILFLTLPITSLDFYTKKNVPGALLCLLLSVIAWFLGRLLPIVGGAVIALLLGMLLANFWRFPDTYKAGISVEEIAKYTNLTPQQVLEIINHKTPTK